MYSSYATSFSIFFVSLTISITKVNVCNNILLYLILCVKWRSGVLWRKSRWRGRFAFYQIHIYFSLCKPVLSRSANLADHYARRHCASQRGVFANETPNVTLAFRADDTHWLRDSDPERTVSRIRLRFI